MGYAGNAKRKARDRTDTMTASPYVLLDDSLTPGGRSLLYTEPERVIAAYTPEEVEAKLDEVAAGLARGAHAAGFFSYELGYCLEPKLRALLPAKRSVPLFWIGLFREAPPARRCGHARLARRAWRRRARENLRSQAVLVARAIWPRLR